MSYAEAVADTKNASAGHPLLEQGWSSAESETESSSGVNEEEDTQVMEIVPIIQSNNTFQ
jgi:hypothetical protein